MQRDFAELQSALWTTVLQPGLRKSEVFPGHEIGKKGRLGRGNVLERFRGVNQVDLSVQGKMNEGDLDADGMRSLVDSCLRNQDVAEMLEVFDECDEGQDER